MENRDRSARVEQRGERALYAQNILNGLVKADPEDKAALEASGKPISRS
jgi:hypothetical protein